MPDPYRTTLSATQSPALFGVSPYLTRWMLLRHFIRGDEIDASADERMSWGTKMQPLVLAQAAEDLKLEVRPNAADNYVRNDLLGCTRDAEIICPDRGPGALETKCVFDYSVLGEKWNGGKNPPKHYELQLQQQMLVGDGTTPYQWGVIAAWVCGEMRYYERKPLDDVRERLIIEAVKFFNDVKAKREGEPFGEPVEDAMLNVAFPVIAGKVLDFTGREDSAALAEQVQMLAWHQREGNFHDRAIKKLKAAVKAVCADSEEAKFDGGIIVRSKSVDRKGYSVGPANFKTIDVFVPNTIELKKPEDIGWTP